MTRAVRCYRAKAWVNPVSAVIRLRKGVMIVWQHEPTIVRSFRGVLASKHAHFAVPRMRQP